MSKKSPQVRFEGFTDDWEERKLKELFQPSKNKNNNGLYNQKDILAASLGTELIPKRTFFGLKSTKESVKNYRIVKTGDLIYTKSPIKGFPNGIIRSNKGNVGIVPPLYCVYTLQKDINSSIIQLYFEDKNRLDLYLFPLVNVGARNNVNITDLEFLEGKVTIPKSYEEQSKIVQFMEQLNTTIDLHQRKLDLLKEQKKGFLQKMFPKNGAKVPELRFAGFTDDWELRKLEEISDKVTEKNKNSEFVETLTNSAEFGIINQRDFFDKNISNEKNLNGYYIVREDDFVYNPRISNYAPVGPIKRNKLGRTGVMSPLYYVFRPYNIDKKFLEYYFDTTVWHKFMKINGDSGARADRFAIKDSIFKTMPIPYPSIEEQRKIGNFFDNLNDTITLHQRKLDLLKEQKKGYLQKMFV